MTAFNNKSSSPQVVQHIQADQYSLLLKEIEPATLLIEWGEVFETYQIRNKEIEYVRKAVSNYNRKNGNVLLLIKIYNGFLLAPESQKKLTEHALFEGVNAVALILESTTHRLSLNLVAQLNRFPVPVRGFATEENAQKWLQKNRMNQNKSK